MRRPAFAALACALMALACDSRGSEGTARTPNASQPRGSCETPARTDAAAPAARIEPGRCVVPPGCRVAFSGATSDDPAGGPVTAYRWSWGSAGPPPFQAVEAGGCDIEFAAPGPGEYEIRLKVRGMGGWSEPAVARIEVVSGAKPAPRDGPRLRKFGAGEAVALGEGDVRVPPAEGGAGRETANLAAGGGSYRWRQVSGPPMSLPPDRLAARVLEFRPAPPGRYAFVRASGDGSEEVFRFEIPPGLDSEFGDRRPVAQLPAAALTAPGHPARLDGSLSFDPDRQELAGRWEKDEVDADVRIEPEAGRRGMAAAFCAPREGIYRVRFFVTDGFLESAAATMYVRVMAGALDTIPSVPSVPASSPDDPFEKPVTFELREGSLQRAIEMFPSHTGLSLLVEKEVADPKDFASIPVRVALKNAPARQAADFICRQIGASYRKEGNRALWVTGANFLAGQKLDVKVFAADALFRESDGGDLRKLLTEAMKGPMFCRPDITIAVDANRQEIQAVAPDAVLDRLGRIVSALRGPANLAVGSAGPRPDQAALRRRLRETPADVEWKARRLDLALRDVEEIGSVNAGFDSREFEGELPKLSFSAKGVTLEDLCREVVKQARFKGFSVQPPNALWFFRRAEPMETSERMWDRVRVRAYAMGDLAAFTGWTPAMIRHYLRHRVYPDSWSDPSVCMVYSEATGKLLVMHAPEAIERIEEALANLWEGNLPEEAGPRGTREGPGGADGRGD